MSVMMWIIIILVAVTGIVVFSFFGYTLWLKAKERKEISQKEEQRINFENLREKFRLSDVGVTCEEFTLLTVAGPASLPPAIRKRMDEHLEDCEYHGSKQFNQSVLDSIVTPELEKTALEVIKKYCDS